MTIQAEKNDIQPSRLRITKNPNPPVPRTPGDMGPWGSTFGAYMLRIEHDAQTGWSDPEIVPFGKISMHPGAPSIQYGISLFEGMKAFRKEDGSIHLFRPDCNMRRMQSSATRLSLPDFSEEGLLECIKALVRLEETYIPSAPNSLYLRPTMYGTRETLGMGGSMDEATIVVFCSPVGPFFPAGFKPVSLLASVDQVRAWPGGTGAYKLAGNYGPCFLPCLEARQIGYDQNLWCLGDTVTEAGQMNFFYAYRNGEKTHLVTPGLDGQILPGVTRMSVLQLARAHIDGSATIPGLPDKDKLVVDETTISLSELARLRDQGDLLEAFGTGTAAVVLPIKRIGIPLAGSAKIDDLTFPNCQNDLGPITRAIYEVIAAIQYGKMPAPPGWSVDCPELA